MFHYTITFKLPDRLQQLFVDVLDAVTDEVESSKAEHAEPADTSIIKTAFNDLSDDDQRKYLNVHIDSLIEALNELRQ